MQKFTIIVGYHQRFEQPITVQAVDVADACNLAIAEAEKIYHWRAAAEVGESFVTAILEGEARRMSDRDTLPAIAVPYRFQALRAAGRADLIPLLRDAAACLSAGIDAYVAQATFTKTLDDEAPDYVQDMEDTHADLHEALRAELKIAEDADAPADNHSRADRAEAAVNYYGSPAEDLSSTIGDLLASTRHLCDREGLDFDQLSATAEIHHLSEREAEL